MCFEKQSRRLFTSEGEAINVFDVLENSMDLCDHSTLHPHIKGVIRGMCTVGTQQLAIVWENHIRFIDSASGANIRESTIECAAVLCNVAYDEASEQLFVNYDGAKEMTFVFDKHLNILNQFRSSSCPYQLLIDDVKHCLVARNVNGIQWSHISKPWNIIAHVDDEIIRRASTVAIGDTYVYAAECSKDTLHLLCRESLSKVASVKLTPGPEFYHTAVCVDGCLFLTHGDSLHVYG
jgi:hypothetical protein